MVRKKNQNCKSHSTKLKISLAHKGKIKSKEHRLNLSKSLAGRTLSKETKDKISKAKKRNPTRYWKDKKLSEETCKKMSKARKGTRLGKNNPAWKGGISSYSHRLRTSAKFQEWRKAIFERDNYTCQNPNCVYCCNKIGANGLLHSHHVIPFAECLSLDWEEEIFDVDNGITHCKNFHNSLHKGAVI